jgi:hypothetical protein
MPCVLLPLALIVLALVSAAFAAYGTAAQWASRWGPSGEQVIYVSRRLQWPVLTVCVLSCIALLLLVVTGKRRAYWLIGLAPVLALFAHRFSTSPMRDFRVAESPAMVSVEQVSPEQLPDQDWVVGVVISPMVSGSAAAGAPEIHAYPYSALWRSPVVVQTALDQRFVLIWNPFANFARAFQIDRDVNPRELEVVSMPVNALLVYNARYGQFINGVTGRQPDGSVPTGFARELTVQAMSWSRWKTLHPTTKVMLPPPRTDTLAVAAAVPVRPRYVIPARTQSPAAEPAGPDASPGAEADLAASLDSPLNTSTVPIETPVVLLGGEVPTVILPTDLSDTPANLASGTVVFRDSRCGRLSGRVRGANCGWHPSRGTSSGRPALRWRMWPH